MLDRIDAPVGTNRTGPISYRAPLHDRLVATVLAAQLGHKTLGIKDPATGVFRDNRMVLTTNPWKMRVWINNGSVVNPTVLPFNTVTFDSANGFNTSTSIYTVPVAGWYQLNAVAIAQ